MDLKAFSMRVLLGQIESQKAKGEEANKEYLEQLKAELERRKVK